MENLIDRVAEVVRQTRSDLGLSGVELARRSGVSRAHVHLIEHGRTVVSIEKFVAIAHGLGMSASDLMARVENQQRGQREDKLRQALQMIEEAFYE
jgi:transcriptional regulator with XRE-family HTH domain